MNLQEFLNGRKADNVTAFVNVSERFKDENGNSLKFKIKAMRQSVFEEIRKKCGGNSAAFNRCVIIENTLEPNFKDAESISLLGLKTPEQYLDNVLLAGEASTLARSIIELSGFKKNIEELVEEVKN